MAGEKPKKKLIKYIKGCQHKSIVVKKVVMSWWIKKREWTSSGEPGGEMKERKKNAGGETENAVTQDQNPPTLHKKGDDADWATEDSKVIFHLWHLLRLDAGRAVHYYTYYLFISVVYNRWFLFQTFQFWVWTSIVRSPIQWNHWPKTWILFLSVWDADDIYSSQGHHFKCVGTRFSVTLHCFNRFHKHLHDTADRKVRMRRNRRRTMPQPKEHKI